MKKILLALLLCLIAVPAMAVDETWFCVDPYPGENEYNMAHGFIYTLNNNPPVEIPYEVAQEVGTGTERALILHADTLSPGNYDITIQAFRDDPAPYGRLVSDPIPFSFIVPNISPPSGGGLYRVSR